VDEHRVHIFPGSDREVTLEQVRNEVRKALREIGRHGDLPPMSGRPKMNIGDLVSRLH
jgi:hypothetical protein